MPSKRKTDRKKMNPRFYVFCEGEKTEPNYFNALIKDKGFQNKLIDVEVIDIEENTARELVDQASRADILPDKDQVWVVFDKDGYTKHNEVFAKAKSKKVNIAFSSISFEIWVLLHFAYTTRQFHKSVDVIKQLKSRHGFDYAKNDKAVYEAIKANTDKAATNAKRMNKAVIKGSPFGTQIYNLNPYTNVYKCWKRW